MEEIKLGLEVKDRVTGFKGIAIGRTTYMQGCNRILVQQKVDKEGNIPEAISFDEPDLEVIGDGVLPKPEKSGGPRPFASKRT